MPRGILRKAIRGAATEGTNILREQSALRNQISLDDRRAQLAAKRDAVLQKYAQENIGMEQTYRTQEREAGQEFQAETQERGFEHDKAMQESSLKQSAKQHAESTGLQREGLGLQREQLEASRMSSELNDEIKTIELENAANLQKFREQYAKEQDPEKRRQLEEMIDILGGKDPNRDLLPVPLKDELGAITGYRIFDKRRRTWIDGEGQAATYNSPEDVRAAYKSGKITREQALEQLKQFPAP